MFSFIWVQIGDKKKKKEQEKVSMHIEYKT